MLRRELDLGERAEPPRLALLAARRGRRQQLGRSSCPPPVQQPLESIFEKTGVHSRRDLVGKVLFSFYEPRLRDNESRAEEDEPLRGGPLVHA